ncbi:unnamed protein product, partial [Prorocentrum cordatum]
DGDSEMYDKSQSHLLHSRAMACQLNAAGEGQFKKLPSRFHPIVLADVNDGVGLVKKEREWMEVETEAVGRIRCVSCDMAEVMEIDLADAPAWIFPLRKRMGEAAEGAPPAQAARTDSAAGGASGGRGGKGGGRRGDDSMDGATLKWAVRQTLANSRAIADMESSINDTFLISEQTWLSQAGLRGNKYYAESVKQLKEKAATDPSTDLGSLGPPWLTVFWIVLAEIKKHSQNGQYKDAANLFWDNHAKDKTPDEIALMARHFSFQVPRGEKSKRMEGMAKFKLHIAQGSAAGLALQELMMRTLTELQAQRLVGSAPRSQAERHLQQWLQRGVTGRDVFVGSGGGTAVDGGEGEEARLAAADEDRAQGRAEPAQEPRPEVSPAAYDSADVDVPIVVIMPLGLKPDGSPYDKTDVVVVFPELGRYDQAAVRARPARGEPPAEAPGLQAREALERPERPKRPERLEGLGALWARERRERPERLEALEGRGWLEGLERLEGLEGLGRPLREARRRGAGAAPSAGACCHCLPCPQALAATVQ